jgi:hypothetical protein
LHALGSLGCAGVVVLGVLYALARNLADPDVVMLGAVAVIITLSLASDRFPAPGDAVRILGNEGLLAVGMLFVVAAGSPKRARCGCSPSDSWAARPPPGRRSCA